MQQIYQTLANAVRILQNPDSREDMRQMWSERLSQIERNLLPSGSGFDSGTALDYLRSTPERLVFTTAFHHMNDAGYYDGWSTHDVIVKPSLVFRLDIRITGKNRNGIKEYIAEQFYSALTLKDRAGIDA